MPIVLFCKSSKLFQSLEVDFQLGAELGYGGRGRKTGIGYCLRKSFATVRNAGRGGGEDAVCIILELPESQFTTCTRGDVPIRAWSVWKRPAAYPAKCSKSFLRLQSVDGRTDTKS